MEKTDKIYIAGHRGLVGSALFYYLSKKGYTNIIVRTHKELDLVRQKEVEEFFLHEKPKYVFLCAARVGGIVANSTYKADFIYQNMLISANVIQASYLSGVIKLLNLGSSCIYPKHAQNPIKEESLLTGSLEITNEPYAIAKIAAIKLCRYYNEQYGTNFISAMPCNLYGPRDNFDLLTSHVLPAMIQKFHIAVAKEEDAVTVWGDGSPRREFLYSFDLADALCFLMKNVSSSMIEDHINIGVGKDISIKELAALVQKKIGFSGKIIWDVTRPNGVFKKCMDITRIQSFGWKAQTSLEEGVQKTYEWFKKEVSSSE